MQIGRDQAPIDLPRSLRILPVNDGVLFPRGILEVVLREPHDIDLIVDAMGNDRLVGVVQTSQESKPVLYRTGCLGRVKQWTDQEDGSYAIKLRGLLRFAIAEQLPATASSRQSPVNFEPFMRDLSAQEEEETVDREAVLNALDRFIAAFPQRIDWEAIYEAPNEVLLSGLAIQGPFSPAEKQALLEAPDLKARSKILLSLFEFELTKGTGTPGKGAEGSHPR
jgi:Lon protease-like protein